MSVSKKQLNLSEWLSWLEQCHPAEIELGLDRIRQVAERLSLDLSQSQVVTVAGTNGKGSTVSYLNRTYLDAGYSVGCYTSPHFIHYNERVKLNDSPVSDQLICDVFQLIDEARGQIPLTYFEFGTLAALVIFSQEKPDLVLLEVGLGGRLDAVNLIDADISVVTTVALDHIDWLGDDRDVIGYEKAGVYRAGKPAICGDLNPPATVRQVAEDKGANFYQVGEQFSADFSGEEWSWQGKDCAGVELQVESIPKPQLPQQNAVTALQIMKLLPFQLEDEQIRSGIASATLTGRMQSVSVDDKTTVWLDVAHNPEAAELLCARIDQLSAPRCLILGMLSDKDVATVTSLLSNGVEQCYLVDLNVPRGEKAELLLNHIQPGVNVELFTDVGGAIQRALQGDPQFENIIVAGSFFTVSDALTVLGRDR